MITCLMLARQATLLVLPPALIPLLPITSLQPLRFHVITHSFAQRQPVKAFPIKGLRTLPVATGVGTPGQCAAVAESAYGRFSHSRGVWRPLGASGVSA